MLGYDACACVFVVVCDELCCAVSHMCFISSVFIY